VSFSPKTRKEVGRVHGFQEAFKEKGGEEIQRCAVEKKTTEKGAGAKKTAKKKKAARR
jgi:hypothetical protein